MNLEFIEASFGSDFYKKLVQLRREILRVPLGLDFTATEIAAESVDFHLAARENGRLVACLVLHPVDEVTLKLRQMAVATDVQGRGIGGQLIRYAEQFAKARDYSVIEMHARKSAQSFYEKLGYQIEGAEFMEVTIPHLKMWKHLNLEKPPFFSVTLKIIGRTLVSCRGKRGKRMKLRGDEIEKIHRLWDELALFLCTRCDEALDHLVKILCLWTGADNARWHATVRLLRGKEAQKDDMCGWHLRTTRAFLSRTPEQVKLF